MDLRVVSLYIHLERENVNAKFSFDNLQIVQKQIEGDFDYISLSKTSPFFLSKEEFADFIKTLKDESVITNHI